MPVHAHGFLWRGCRRPARARRLASWLDSANNEPSPLTLLLHLVLSAPAFARGAHVEPPRCAPRALRELERRSSDCRRTIMQPGDTFPDRAALTAAVERYAARATPTLRFTTTVNSRDSDRINPATGRRYTPAEVKALKYPRGTLSTLTFRCSGQRRTGCPFRLYVRQTAADQPWYVRSYEGRVQLIVAGSSTRSTRSMITAVQSRIVDGVSRISSRARRMQARRNSTSRRRSMGWMKADRRTSPPS